MANERTEPVKRSKEDVLAMSPIKVILGGKEYSITPQVIRDSREWRKKVGPWKADLSRLASIDSDNPKDFHAALIEVTVTRIDQMGDFFFEYAKDLPRDIIEGEATEKELVAAFEKVCNYAFPFG